MVKLQEYNKLFSRYGITVAHLPVDAPLAIPSDDAALQDAPVTHVIREESSLDGVDFVAWCANPVCVPTRFVSVLTATLPDGSTKTYSESCPGFLIPKNEVGVWAWQRRGGGDAWPRGICTCPWYSVT